MHLGAILAVLEAILAVLEASWRPSWAILAVLEAILGPSWGNKGIDRRILRSFPGGRRDGPKPTGEFFWEKNQNQNQEGPARQAPL